MLLCFTFTYCKEYKQIETAIISIIRFSNCLIFFIAVDKTPPGFPLITQSPQTRVIEIGHTAVMQCKSTGNPNPKIHWLKDGKRLEMNQRYTLIDGKL